MLCGAVRCWEGEEAHRLGELLYMGPVKYASSASIVTDVKDRHLVLFSQCIVFLSVSQRLSAFVFEVSLLCLHLEQGAGRSSSMVDLA